MTTDSDQRPETWKAIPCFSKYEASDLGRVRSVRTGNVLATRVSNSGYLLVKLYDDDARQQTRTVHSLVLLTFAGPRPDGMETLHGLGGPLDNRWPENLRYGTKKENAADQAAAGTARRPATHPCVNHERCGGMVVNQGSRCLPCVAAVGDRAAAMLSAGMSLDAATRRLGYSNAEWVFKLAARHGGYAQPIQHARAQGRRWPQRLTATLRYHLSGGHSEWQTADRRPSRTVTPAGEGTPRARRPASPACFLGPLNWDKWDICPTTWDTLRSRVAVRNHRTVVTERDISPVVTRGGVR